MNTAWFERIKNLRDDCVEHHPGAGRALAFRDDKAFVVISTRKKDGDERRRIIMNSTAKYVSMEELDEVVSRLKVLLLNFDEYLRSHMVMLPIKVR